MQLPTFLRSKYFRWAVKGIAACVAILLIFQLGVYVGFRKAKFSYRWADNYHRMFGGPRNGFLRNFPREFDGGDFTSSHGVAGTVIDVADGSLVIQGRDDTEKDVRVTRQTVIRRGRETIASSELSAGDLVVVFGSPGDDGTIEAKVIRLFEGPPDAPPSPFGFSRFPRK